MKEFSSKDMDHLGLVAGMCDEIGLVETIDQIIPPDPRSGISVGECAKLMIINGLGFSSRPLYLEAQFFSSKSTKRLLGRELPSEEISDDRLGRALDRLYAANCEHIFSTIASKVVTRFNVDARFRHLDTTSMSVQGEYEEEGIGLIEFGYSKDQNPNLKQFMVSLMSSQDGDVPLLAQTIAGNTSDKKHFREVLKALKEEMEACGEGYFASQVCSLYGAVRQRWVLVFSEKAYVREKKTVEKRVSKAAEKYSLELKKLCRKEYSCEADALRDLKDFRKALKYHKCNFKAMETKLKMGKRGRPKKTDQGRMIYQLNCELKRDESKITEILKAKGKFIIATNELDSEKLSVEDLLINYKKQQSVERGFRFLKDPIFMTSSVFLKKEERIVALGFIMCLCLLTYTLSQRKLRLRLQQDDEKLPNQKKKPTKKPTMRWIYQMFEGVHILYRLTEIGTTEIVLNLNPLRMKILQLMGPRYQKIYEDAA